MLATSGSIIGCVINSSLLLVSNYLGWVKVEGVILVLRGRSTTHRVEAPCVILG